MTRKLLFACWIFLLTATLSACSSEGRRVSSLTPFVEFVKKDMGETVEGRRTLVILIGFSDFSCPLCYEDFVLLTKFLNSDEVVSGRPMIRIYVRQEGRPFDELQPAVAEWAQVVRIGYPVTVVSDSLLAGARSRHIYLFDHRWEVVKQDSFPMGGERAMAMVQALMSGE